MESVMAGLNYSTLETTAISVYNLPTSWQLLVVGSVFVWLMFAQLSTFTKYFRASVQPFVLRHVESGVPMILAIQKHRHPQLDSFLGALATLVSVEFYSLVLPMLFWHGQPKLARQLTLLMASCIYVGNCVKDAVCAPRPPSPVCRVVSSGTEETSSAEYGLPSSHTINIICFAGYVLHYLADQEVELSTFLTIAALFTTITSLVIYGRLYLGMHSPIDVVAGFAIGTSLLLAWCTIDEYLDVFITNGENVISFWAAVSILALYAYPTPESPTPSFEYHTAFNGVAFGIVSGVHRTFPLYHSGHAFKLSLAPDVGVKTAVGIFTIFAAKEGSKYLATIFLPYICYLLELLLGFRFQSSSYVKSMRKKGDVPAPVETPKLGGMLKAFYKDDELMDVDTGIRFVQYATLGWAVVELVPHLFSRLAL